MPTRELIKRLVEIKEWENIPKKDKNKKTTWIYYRNGRKYNKALFIAYQKDEDNVLLRFPNSAFFKKYKSRDKIYIDSSSMYIKDMKRMVKGWKQKDTKKVKSKKKILLKF